MSDVIVPIGREFLVLTQEQFEEARERGRVLLPATPLMAKIAAHDEILDATGMEQRTAIPGSWWLEQARHNAIPHIRAGKYVRFNFMETLAAVRREPMYTDKRSVPGKIPPAPSVSSKRGFAAATKRRSRLEPDRDPV